MAAILAFFRCIIIIVNVLFMLIGLGAIGLGSWVISQQDKLSEDLSVVNDNNQIQWIGVGFIAFGAIVFLTSFCGFCGVVKKIKCLLICYTVILFLALAVQITIGVLFVTLDASAEINSFASNQWMSTDPTIVTAVVAFQDFANCCGWDMQPVGIPGNTCMVTPAVELCKDVVDEFVDSLKNPVSYGLIAFGAIELLSFIGACLLLCKNDDQDDEEWGDEDI